MVISKSLIAFYIAGLALAGKTAAHAPMDQIPTPPPIASEAPAATEQPGASPIPVVTQEPVPTPTPATDAILYMEVTQVPASVEYGSTPAANLFTVTITRVSGLRETVYPESVSGDLAGIGPRTVTLTYQGFSTTAQVQVVPRKAAHLTLSDGTKTSVKVSWDRLEEATAYEVEIKDSAESSYMSLGRTTEPVYEFTGLTQGHVRYVHVRAIAEGTDPSTGATISAQGEYTADFAIAPRPDDMTGPVKVTKMTRTAVVLKWDAVPGALAYAVYYHKSDEKKFEYGGEAESAGKFKLTGLSGGYDYVIKVIPYAIQESNAGAPSAEVKTGTAPTLPTLTVRGGDGTVRVYFGGGRGAEEYKLYYSEDEEGDYELFTTLKSPVAFKVRSIHSLLNNTTYYIKMAAERTVTDKLLTSESDVVEVDTTKASPTSVKAKLYRTKKKLKNAPAIKNYKQFKKTFDYAHSFPMPGLINTNAGGFNSTSMVPQSIAAYENHILIASYDLNKSSDSVIYVVDGDDKSLETLILLPHKGHVGGIACDGTNIWLAYGKKIQCFPCSVVEGAIESGEPYIEIYDFTNTVETEETVSYITYYRDRVWAGAYNELAPANVYIYRVEDKETKPNLVRTGKMMMPDRTQGLCFTENGVMIVSRSCQTNKYQRGFMSKIEIYKPKINVDSTMKRGAVKTYLAMPPMNEGIMVSGSYAYVVFESPAFSGCEAPMDRVIAFRTNKLVKVKKPS